MCHQLMERTIFIDGMPLPFCARDTGIYLGIFIVLVYCIVRGKLRSDRVPSTGISVILAILMIPMMVDAVTSYISIRQTDNIIRLVTGIFFGMSMGILLIPAANFKVYEANKLKIIDGWIDVVILSFINILVCVVILRFSILRWAIVATASIIGLVFIIGRFIFTLIKMLNIGNPKSSVLYASVLTIIAFGLLYVLRCLLLGPIRSLIL